jgi:hypothetical protein
MSASYPGSVKSFANRSAGQTIASAHINDLQDEVAAIEDGLLNGTARLNSSNATVASLTVTGAATFSRMDISGGSSLSALQVNGASTFASRPVIPAPDAIRVGLNAKVDLVAASTTAISWSTATFKTNAALHSTTTNPDRLTPQSSGVYAIAVQLVASNRANTAVSTANLFVSIEDSSGGIIAQATAIDPTAAPPQQWSVSAFGLKYFDSVAGSTQWVRVVAASNTPSTNSLDNAKTYAHMYKLY